MSDKKLELFIKTENSPVPCQGIPSAPLHIVVHPGAGWLYKCWPKEKFSRLIGMILDDHGKHKVFVTVVGGNEDSRMLDYIADCTGDRVRVLKGSSLLEVASVIRHAHLFVGNDSGLLHMAEAFDIPFVALFGPSRPETVGPLSSGIFIRKPVECSPCRQIECHKSSLKEKTCMDLIKVEEVHHAVNKTIAGLGNAL